ncbi:uncharacterized protein LOC130210161 [Pseudoliparis swirei]|uniref:uncharacterized protein LOC130210161 n=1 Tax=Pseudoliparis swirei TaxID=2059687 RepID=UPI0024BD68B8|nr:uncharacterized protein LOC130210161 [Pseudoliparis swirei]
MSHASPVMSHASHAPAEAIVMDEDEELERMMLSISPSKQHLFLHLRHPPHLPDDEKEVFNPEHRAADRHNWDHEFLSHMQQDSSGVDRVLVLFVFWCSACCPRDDEWTLVLMRQPGVHLPAVFDPALMAQLNAASERVLGQMKYPAFHLSSTDTGEKFGLQYVEPGCRPVPVDWDKHRTKSDSAPPALNPPPQSSVPTVQSSSLFMAPQKLFQFPPRLLWILLLSNQT